MVQLCLLENVLSLNVKYILLYGLILLYLMRIMIVFRLKYCAEDIYSMKNEILKENIDKSGIYKLTNKLTGHIYVGQSTGRALFYQIDLKITLIRAPLFKK